jgi:hypothetical protein
LGRFQSNAVIDTKAGVFPGAHIIENLLGDLPFGQKQPENSVFPEFKDRVKRKVGQWYEAGVGQTPPSDTKA